MRTTPKTTTLILCAALTLGLGAASALALSDEQHKKMLKSSPAYAKADAELGRAWKALRAAFKRADLESQFNGVHIESMLNYQRAWLERERDERARELRGGGSEADGYAAAARERAEDLRRMAKELNAFADLPAPAPDAAFSRLLAANGGSLRFALCTGDDDEEEEEEDAAKSCTKTADEDRAMTELGYGAVFLEFYADDGIFLYRMDGRADKLPGGWKLLADGRIRVYLSLSAMTYAFSSDGKYLKGLDDSYDSNDWFVLRGPGEELVEDEDLR